MVPPEAPYPDVYTDTFIFFLRSFCKIIWINVHYFPNAPRKGKKNKSENQRRNNANKGKKTANVKFEITQIKAINAIVKREITPIKTL